MVLVIIVWCFYFHLCHLAFMECQLFAEHQTLLTGHKGERLVITSTFQEFIGQEKRQAKNK